jgi:hypothetical protein
MKKNLREEKKNMTKGREAAWYYDGFWKS